jgi:thiaminase/transcriptional activator TenA
MSVSSELWQANKEIARACLEHPFVQGIADGTLERHKFAYYVGQDAFSRSFWSCLQYYGSKGS